MDGEGESAIPQDTKVEAAQNLEDDWQHDMANPRNWSSGKKWVCSFFKPRVMTTKFSDDRPLLPLYEDDSNATIITLF